MRDNNLEEGDLCAFTLIKDIIVLIEVVIFHTKEAETQSLSPDIFDNEDHENDEEGDDESEDEEETEDDEEEEEDDDSSETLSCVPLGSRTVSSRLHKRRRNWTSSIAKSQSNIKSGGGLSRAERTLNAIALGKANAFKSESASPSFVVSLGSSYAGGSYVNFPCSFSEKYITERRPNHIILWVESVEKSFWINVNYIGRTTRLQAGWSEFARVNNLKMGDVCVFVLTNTKTFEFDVEIFHLTDVCTSSQGKRKQLRTDSTHRKQKSRKNQ
ncbi:hypothetical protein ACLB2K_001226 [Fragaria x ananassa]